jgi:hypothetical protein
MTMTDFGVHRWNSATNAQIPKLRLVGSLRGHADLVRCLSRIGGMNADLAVLNLETPASAIASLKPPNPGVAARLCNSRFFRTEAHPVRTLRVHFPPFPYSNWRNAIEECRRSRQVRGHGEFSMGRIALKPSSERNLACYPHHFHSHSPNESRNRLI